MRRISFALFLAFVFRVAALAQTQATQPVRPPEPTGEASLLGKTPEPGMFVDFGPLPPDLTAGSLENGIRVYLRRMEQRGEVLIGLNLHGGRIEEDATNVGVSQAAALVFSAPASHNRTNESLATDLSFANVRVSGAAELDAITLTLRVPAKELRTALELVHLLLTEGRIDPAVFSRWVTDYQTQWRGFKMSADAQASVTAIGLATGDDLRLMPVDVESAQKQSLSTAQAWFDRLAKSAPATLAIVGDMSPEDARPLIETYVGSLPRRVRELTDLKRLRQVRPAAEPWQRRASVLSVKPGAVVVEGFDSGDARAAGEQRALNLARLVLQGELQRKLRDELGLSESLAVGRQVIAAYDDLSLFLVTAACAPDKAELVASTIQGQLQSFAEAGPGAQDFDEARARMREALARQRSEAAYWLTVLRTLDSHRISLSEREQDDAAYAALTPERVREVLASCLENRKKLSVIAIPTSQPTEEERSKLGLDNLAE